MKKYTKYTDLEQASRDPSLAIITDRITTPEELSKLYAKYRILPKKQKRYSNYYSNEFQGRRVSEMYVLMKDKFKPGGELSEAWQMPKDAFVVSEPDLYYKEESFNKGDTNICFILGHSGSGKSRMASTLEGDVIDHIELDDLLLTRDHFSMDELKAYSDMIYSFFSGKGAKYYIGADQRDSIPKEEYEDRVFVDFVEFAMEYAGQHREKKFILDGIWIYLYFDDPSVFEDYAVFIKGTSFLKSKMRAMNREMHRDKETLQDRKKMFGREARNYLLDEEKINSYRSFFGGKPETIFRSETNETDPETEAVIKELNTIDRGFVNNDPDVIRETLKRAEANTDLSEWNKVMIINECTAALFELKA
jgi:energy-coupling factor transporter ATP-binding protein EcfA2